METDHLSMEQKKGFLNLLKKNWASFLILSLTLGLAPFTPEPHLIGKIRWVLGGANGMQTMDWFDLVLHGTPWVLLILSVSFRMLDRGKVSAPK